MSTSSSGGELPPIRITNIGSWPGTDMMDAIKIAFAECPDLPYLPELPARGPHTQLIGRSTAFLAGLTGTWSPCGFSMVDSLGRGTREGKPAVTAAACLACHGAAGHNPARL